MTQAATVPAVLNKGMKRQVIKHSSAIQIGTSDGDISLMQRKAFNVLLAHAYDELINKDRHRMTIKDLCRYLNFESNNTKHLKETLRGLVNTKVEWNILGADRQGEWGVAALLAEVQIKGGFCYWEYTSTIRKMLYNPTIYARINLTLQNQISSKHSLILYENIFFYYRAADGCGETPWIDIATLRKLLSLKPGEYELFKTLNSAVIKKSLKEINEKTELQVTVEFKRRSRKVVALKFFVRLKSKQGLDGQVTCRSDKDLMHRMVNDYGIKETQARKLIKEFEASRILENLVLVDQDRKDGKVNGNLAGYAVTAIKTDFRRDRKPAPKAVPVYEGMHVIYKGKEYIVDSSMSIQVAGGGTMPEGQIVTKIRSGEIRVLELLLFPGIKLLIDGQVRTIKNSYGAPVINEDGLYLSEEEIKTGIKTRKYIILEYPQIDTPDV